MKPKKDGIKEILEAGYAPGFIVKGRRSDEKPFEKGTMVPSDLQGKATAEEVERAELQAVKEMSDKAADEKAHWKGRKRPDGAVRRIGAIPPGLFSARIRESGNPNYWTDEGRDALKRDDLFFGD